jgi:hypothetical protein
MASSEQALRNTSAEAVKTEICLSAASSFPFSLCVGFLFANFFFSSRKRKSGRKPEQQRKVINKE